MMSNVHWICIYNNITRAVVKKKKRERERFKKKIFTLIIESKFYRYL